ASARQSMYKIHAASLLSKSVSARTIGLQGTLNAAQQWNNAKERPSTLASSSKYFCSQSIHKWDIHVVLYSVATSLLFSGVSPTPQRWHAYSVVTPLFFTFFGIEKPV